MPRMSNVRDISIRYLKGIGPKKAALFAERGIFNVEDLLYYFPRRYEDRSRIVSVSQLQEGQVQTIQAQVLAQGERRSFRGRAFTITEIAVADPTGRIFCVWFNQPYLKRYFKAGVSLILHGKVERYGRRLQMSAPEFEVVTQGDEGLSAGRIVPVYTLPKGVTQRTFRALISRALDEHVSSLQDDLPYDIRARQNLLNLVKSVRAIHFPDDEALRLQAYERLAFEEFFLFQIPLALRKQLKQQRPGIAHSTEGEMARDFIAGLPFTLTSDQMKAVGEIRADMGRPQVMQRLLQGDVGSGKTVVAVFAGMIAVQGGYQAAFMVPTEVLARQHYVKIREHVTAGRGDGPKIGLLVSSLDKKKKEEVFRAVKAGEIDIIIGTHSLLEENLQFKQLGLVVIDEQHKFGVGQRALLPQKGVSPDVLIMTATPIPRTLAITLYGDLDISVIRQLPPGRQPVTTIHVKHDNRKQAYERVRMQVRQGRQVYIIYPVIEESYFLDIAGARRMYDQLKSGEFKGLRVGLMHGKLKQEEQDQVMSRFREHALDILVATTVLEVGIDVANAACIVIEHAERFGLSQLHQLRGRVGRGAIKSECILVSDPATEEARRRIDAMVAHTDGFRIAEEDLRIRGPGEFFGARQHGLTDLRIGNPLSQLQLLKRARDEAIKLVRVDPYLTDRQHVQLRERLVQRFPEYEKVMMVG